MEGKGLNKFVVVVLVLCLLGQTQVEADAIWCCKNTTGKGFFKDCISKGYDAPWCAVNSGCVPMMDHCGGAYPVYAGDFLITIDSVI